MTGRLSVINQSIGRSSEVQADGGSERAVVLAVLISLCWLDVGDEFGELQDTRPIIIDVM